MRVCYVCSDLGIPLNGHKGASAHVRSFIKALSGEGHDVVAVVSEGADLTCVDVPVVTIDRATVQEYEPQRENLRVHRALRHIWNNPKVEQHVRAVVNSFDAEVIYERYSPFSIAGVLCAREMNMPHILEVNALLSEEGKVYRSQALSEASVYLESVALHETSLIVTVSQSLCDAIVARGIDRDKVLVVPNGVDEMFFDASDISLKAQYRDKVVIGFVGSLKPWHGIDILMETFSLLMHDERFHLLIVGDGPERKKLNALHKLHPGRITLTGNVRHDRIPDYLHAMDIAVAPYPALDEFYFSPLKVLEYMAAGKAIVATNIGQIADLLSHRETGWLIDKPEPQAFADAIAAIAHDGELMTQLGRTASQIAKTEHQWTERVALIMRHAVVRKDTSVYECCT